MTQTNRQRPAITAAFIVSKANASGMFLICCPSGALRRLPLYPARRAEALRLSRSHARL